MPALDVAIGLSFIFLMLSLFCTAVQEMVSTLLAWRAKELEKGFRAMLLQDTKTPTGAPAAIIDDLYNSPLISGLQKRSWWPIGKKHDRRMPSYVAPRSFALTLLDTLAPPPTDATQPHDVIAAVKTKLNSDDLPANMRDQLRPILIRAEGDRDKFRIGIEEWFD